MIFCHWIGSSRVDSKVPGCFKWRKACGELRCGSECYAIHIVSRENIGHVGPPNTWFCIFFFTKLLLKNLFALFRNSNGTGTVRKIEIAAKKKIKLRLQSGDWIIIWLDVKRNYRIAYHFGKVSKSLLR